MSPERFADMAQAYGGDLDRWPATSRLEAERWLARAPEAAGVLSQARGLDHALDGFYVPPPSAVVRGRITTTLLQQSALARRIRRWVSGLGAVGVLGTGALAGAMAMTLVLVSIPSHVDPDAGSPLYEQSSFGDVAVVSTSAASARS